MEINQGILRILVNERIDEDYFMLTFEAGDMRPEAGQFIMIDCISKKTRKWSAKHFMLQKPLLKRPFSFYLSSTDGDLSILYKVKKLGKGTGCLPRLKLDDEIAYMGPVGNSIDIKKFCSKEDTVHLVGGGIGIAPITFLAQKLIGRGYKVKVYFGVKELGEFLDFCLDNLKSIGLDQDNVHISSESMDISKLVFWDLTIPLMDGYYNLTFEGYFIFIGSMIAAFNAQWFCDLQLTKGPVFMCAPYPVMEYIQKFVISQKKECYCFMEERMACGIGVCMSCNVNGKLICKDGPCINSKDVFGK